MCQVCLIYFYFFNIYICTKRYHGMHKYQQVNFFSNVVKSVRPTYSNKEELATLTIGLSVCKTNKSISTLVLTFGLSFIQFFLSYIQIIDICCVVFTMMKFHYLG